jgi:hypothetical protein
MARSPKVKLSAVYGPDCINSFNRNVRFAFCLSGELEVAFAPALVEPPQIHCGTEHQPLSLDLL